MKKTSFIPLFLAVAATAGTISDYKLTTGTYDNTDDLLAKVKLEFGASAVIADFSWMKRDFDSAPAELVSLLGTVNGAAFVTYNGSQYYEPDRAYFAAVHNGVLPGGWMAHDTIDNHMIDLGSWYLTSVHILAYTGTTPAVPEPSTYGIAFGSLAIALAALRRRKAR